MLLISSIIAKLGCLNIYRRILPVACLIAMNFLLIRGQESVPCHPRKISCFHCNSSDGTVCLDPFPKRELASPNIPTVECYEDCFKWLYIDQANHRRMIRGCSSQLSLKIDRHLICMYESRSRGGYICFCTNDRCNRASANPPILAIIFSLAATLHGLLFF